MARGFYRSLTYRARRYVDRHEGLVCSMAATVVMILMMVTTVVVSQCDPGMAIYEVQAIQPVA